MTFNIKDLNYPAGFVEWLVGFTDAEGSFTFNKGDTGGWRFVFKITQKNCNLDLLRNIQHLLRAGNIYNNNADATKSELVFSDQNSLINIIVPIFEAYPLRTSKYYRYQLWLEALLVKDHALRHRNKLLLEAGIPKDYKSPFELDLIDVTSTKPWIVGFTEGDGCFCLCIYKNGKDTGNGKTPRLYHVFNVSQAGDKHILEQIRKLFKITSNVGKRRTATAVCYKVETLKKDTIERIISFFDGALFGVKKQQFDIWKTSFFNDRNNYEKLNNVREQMRNMVKNTNHINEKGVDK